MLVSSTSRELSSTSREQSATVQNTRDEAGLLHFDPTRMSEKQNMDGDTHNQSGFHGIIDLAISLPNFNELASTSTSDSDLADVKEFEIAISLK